MQCWSLYELAEKIKHHLVFCCGQRGLHQEPLEHQLMTLLHVLGSSCSCANKENSRNYLHIGKGTQDMSFDIVSLPPVVVSKSSTKIGRITLKKDCQRDKGTIWASKLYWTHGWHCFPLYIQTKTGRCCWFSWAIRWIHSHVYTHLGSFEANFVLQCWMGWIRARQ